MKNMLEKKVVLITGSSRGIGAATAKLAVGYGAKVILHGRSESEELKNLASQLKADYIVCDVSDERKIQAEVDNVIKKAGKIDALVNCAGITEIKPFLQLTRQDWERTLNINLLGTFFFCQAVAKVMLAQKYGKIINVASVRGLDMGRTVSIPYAASKAAVINLTKTLAKELAPFINVNAVAPGPVETETAKLWSPSLREEFIDNTLLERLANPEDIAEVILFLASDKAGFITGQTLIVDGGYSISGK